MIREFIEKNEPKVQRALEILPGALIWSIILFPVWGSFFIPTTVAYLIIGFNVYWLYRSLQLTVFGLRGYGRIRRSENINWEEKYKEEKTPDFLDWDDVYHVVIIPNAGESVEKLSANLDALAAQTIDKSKLLVVLAMEERIKGSRNTARLLLEKYAGVFGKLWTTFHPANLPGEIIGKASNEAWAAKRTKEKLEGLGLDIRNVTLTSCDADACFHPKYFEALTHGFARNSKRYLRFWQSPVFGYNNLWRVPAFIRVTEILGVALRVADLQEPTRLFFNYSCYSASFKMIDEIGYWDANVIPEDWHVFLQSFFSLGGKVEVEPIFLPTSIDAPEGRTYFGSLVSRYKQCRRHAWGASDISYAVIQFFKHPEIPLVERVLRVYKLVEAHILWSTNWFLITLGANLPPLLNPAFRQTTLGRSLLGVSQTILAICLLGLGATILLDGALRPPRPKEVPWRAIPAHYLQWFLMPVATFFMACLPALDSHTRLMLGKRLEYWVTEKY